MLETLREDFTRLPELLALGAPEQPSLVSSPEPEDLPEPVAPEPSGAGTTAVKPAAAAEPRDPRVDQLGLF
jgi:hypothetical protein